MSAKRRKDNKGRVLKDGESQRSDGTYMYRFSDFSGKRHCVYAPDLKLLREKEETLSKDKRNGVDYKLGKITIKELIDRYMATKMNLATSTLVSYGYQVARLNQFPFMNMPIKKVTTLDAKQFIAQISDGKRYKTVLSYKAILSAAFDLAVEENILQRNPFSFSLRTVVGNSKAERYALTDEQVRIYFDYIHNHSCYCKYEDLFRILLCTGLRISELLGLTIDDIDLENRFIRVDHQLIYFPSKLENRFSVVPPKSDKGNRYIPMSDEVYQCFLNVIMTRPHPDVEPVVDGYTNFLFLSKFGSHVLLRENLLIQAMGKIERSYKKHNPDKPPLPHVTPHIFRHTFCTNLIKSGMNVKAVQYIMGHANPQITLSVYSHTSRESAFDEYYRAMSAANSGYSLTTQNVATQVVSSCKEIPANTTPIYTTYTNFTPTFENARENT